MFATLTGGYTVPYGTVPISTLPVLYRAVSPYSMYSRGPITVVRGVRGVRGETHVKMHNPYTIIGTVRYRTVH